MHEAGRASAGERAEAYNRKWAVGTERGKAPGRHQMWGVRKKR